MTDLPRNLARPRNPERVSLVANIVVGGVLILINLGLLAYAVLT